MALELMFVFMERVGKFLAVFTALAGLLYLFLDKAIVGCILLLVTSFLIDLWLLGIATQEERVQASLRYGRPLPSPMYSERRRSLARWAILAVSLSTVILVVGLFTTNTYSASITVFSAQYPFASTGLRVHEGDQLRITVQGQHPLWDCGRTFVIGPDGFEEKSADTVYPEANACALIGSVTDSQPQVYFLAGSRTTLSAPESGILYLGCNDSIDSFADNPADSALEVRVSVSNWLNSIPVLLALINLIPMVTAFIPSFRRGVFTLFQLYR